MEASALEAMLTQRVVVTHGETFTIQADMVNANLTRDAIVKSLYEVQTDSRWFAYCCCSSPAKKRAGRR